MKKTILATIMGIMLLSTLALADQVNMNISVNGEANLNITVDADDTEARAMIAQMQLDAYGTMTGSGPADMILDEIQTGEGNPIVTTEGMNTVYDLCEDPFLKNYLGNIGELPPLDFVDYVKALGYDDEAHINLIWTICQQKYIAEKEERWSSDTGVQVNDMVRFIAGGIEWLVSRDPTLPDGYKKIGSSMDSYFASDKDVWILVNKIKELEVRLETLEKTMERVDTETYCDAKLEAMDKYNLSYVKCGENSTIYAQVNPDEFGIGVVGYTTNEVRCEEDWTCTEWGECVDGEMNRVCTDANLCGTTDNMPLQTQGCVEIEIMAEEDKSNAPQFSYLSMTAALSNIQGFLFPLFIV
ncbi:MAG: hypothetical protein JW700_03260 [Candidatus Aenigmarchaeota archaeon]|nr:hypothetical protein [Candidatus Aenigmarchaeota archaeon]